MDSRKKFQFSKAFKFPTYAQYCASYRRYQIFSLPNSIIYYIAKNPSSSKLYQKLMQTCKYFFIKNPILVIYNLKFVGENEWQTHSLQYHGPECCKEFSINKISSKIWITEKLIISSSNQKTALSSNLIPKLFKCDAKTLDLNDQILAFDELLFICGNTENYFSRNVTFLSKEEPKITEKKFHRILGKCNKFHVGNTFFKKI